VGRLRNLDGNRLARRCRSLRDPIEVRDQPPDAVVEGRRAHRHGLFSEQRLQRVRHVLGARQAGVDGNRDQGHAPRQRGFQLPPDAVVGVLKRPPAFVGDAEPVRPDHRQDDVRLLDRLLDQAGHRGARVGAGDVRERVHLPGSVARPESRLERHHVAGRVAGSVTDEDAGHA
jgi:hypothetical protein